MGKGKGEPAHWMAEVKPGTILFEVGGVAEALAVAALARVSHKMPIRTKLARRRAHV
jgi:large subunit ribosomal protein L16